MFSDFAAGIHVCGVTRSSGRDGNMTITATPAASCWRRNFRQSIDPPRVHAGFGEVHPLPAVGNSSTAGLRDASMEGLMFTNQYLELMGTVNAFCNSGNTESVLGQPCSATYQPGGTSQTEGQRAMK